MYSSPSVFLQLSPLPLRNNFHKVAILSVPINVIVFISEGTVKFMEVKTTLFLFITKVNCNCEFTVAVHNVMADIFNLIMSLSGCKP